MYALDQPVTLNGKLFVSCYSLGPDQTVQEYTPEHDQWAELPLPSVKNFTIATLKGQLLVVGGKNKSTGKKTNTIFTFDEHSRQWIQSHPAMPTALTIPAVIGYQDHLIVAGGKGSSDYISDVNFLDTASNQWITAQPLISTEHYNPVLNEETIFLVAQYTQTLLRAHVPTLLSGAKSGVWEMLSNTPYYRSSPVTIGNTLLTVGGSDKPRCGNPTASIQMYNPTTNQWTRVGDLPEPMSACCCTILLGKLFVLESRVYVSVKPLV